MSNPVVCALKGCQRRVSPLKLQRGGKYCSHEHQRKAADQRSAQKRAERKKAARLAAQATPLPTERKGEVYDWLMDPSNRIITQGILDGRVPASYAAHLIGCTEGAVSRALSAVRITNRFEELKAEWQPSWKVKAMLPKWKLDLLRDMDTADPQFEPLLDELVHAYALFSRYYFRLEGKRPIIKAFHLKWIKATIRAYLTGGKQLILSPPRHGKSEMLVRFVVWFIVMDPNIRIGWFCASKDVAQLMLGAVKDYLENSELLIADTLPPGDVYRPARNAGKPWSAKEIKVNQQSHVGQKSSSLLALGRTSKFLSRDMDLIIIDDLEDFDSTREPAQREYSRNKLAEIGTRKEEHTAEVYIGSRQHPDDVPNQILQFEGSVLQWRVIVDSAHSEECDQDPDDWEAHVDCMLFPEVRSYRWLMEKKVEMETLGLPHAYPMRYLNRAIPPEGQVFDVDTIREVALDRDRGCGLEGLPLGHLVGGLDPSARGTQAAFCWHYTSGAEGEPRLGMVDLETQRAGGMAGAVKVIREWVHAYGLTHWFYETNAQQIEFYKSVVKEVQTKPCHICDEAHPEIVIKDHNTGTNKKDAELGISAMAPLYHSGQISLPYGTNDSRIKVNMLLRQLELWTTDGVKSSKAVTDIKMAQWFPFAGKIQRWMKDQRKLKTKYAAEASYTEYDSTGAPWSSIEYPGM